MIKFVPGYLPSPDDPRDAIMPMYATVAAPISAEFSPDVIYDQGKFGMCVAFALSYVIAAQELKQRGKLQEVSQAYIYGNRLSTDYQGEGMMPRQALKMATRFGAVKRQQMPDTGSYPFCSALVSEKSKELDGEGIPQRIKGYVRLRNIVDVYNYIQRFGLPVLMGAQLTESFMQTLSDGAVPPPLGANLGGHEMVIKSIVDYKGKLCYMGPNSWGPQWGMRGNFILDPSYYTLEMWGIIPEEAPDIMKRPRQIMMTIGSQTMVTDQGTVKLPQAPCYVNGNTMIPLRAPHEALGFTVKWYKMSDGRDVISMIDGGELSSIEEVPT